MQRRLLFLLLLLFVLSVVFCDGVYVRVLARPVSCSFALIFPHRCVLFRGGVGRFKEGPLLVPMKRYKQKELKLISSALSFVGPRVRMLLSCSRPPCEFAIEANSSRFDCLTGSICLLDVPGSFVARARDRHGCSARNSIVFLNRLPNYLIKQSAEPISSVEELLALPDAEPRNRVRDHSFPAGLLVCHDFKNNDIVSNRWLVFGEDDYAFVRWPLIGSFVFFGHARVTVPPSAWIQAARRNNRPILGTVMLDDSSEASLLFENAEESARRLACIAQSFDGWLINVETSVSANVIPKAKRFLEMLKQWCFVVLYDCFQTDGKHACQRTLNAKNRDWLSVVDALYLDYAWKLSELPSNHHRIFVGTDSFGRNTFGGGGLNSGLALMEVLNKNLSNALFAPAWAFETTTSTAIENQYWTGCPWKQTIVDKFQRAFLSNLTTRSSSFGIEATADWGLLHVIVEVPIQTCLVNGCPFVIEVGEQRMEGRCFGFNQVAEISFSKFNLTSATVFVYRDEARDCVALDRKVNVRFHHSAWPCRYGVQSAYPGELVPAPAHTTFCVGKGDFFAIDGRIWRPQGWVNMGLQSTLPNLLQTRSFFMEFSFEQVWSFGSSLRLLAISAETKIPVFYVQSCAQKNVFVVVVHRGRLETNLKRVRFTNLSNGWTEQVLECHAGVFEVMVPDLEAFLGEFSLGPLFPCVEMNVSSLETKDGTVLSWQKPHHGVTDVFDGEELICRTIDDTCLVGGKRSKLVARF